MGRFSEKLITAAGLLTRLKTVDGSGSGLDSDTVDGLHAADLASVAHTHPESDVVNLVNDLAGKQPLHANLTGLAGASAAAEVVLYFDSSSGSISTTFFPAFGRSVANLTNAGAGRSLFELGNIDNTSDANKPISTATQTAFDLKANLASPTFTTSIALTTAGGTFTTLSRALPGGASANEVGLETTAATSNVAYYRNLSSTGYSAATFRDHLNVEHMAQGWHNSLGFAYTEVSNFGGDTAAAPPGYLFQQTGTMTFADSGTEYRQWNVQRIGGDDGIITWYAGTFRGEGLNVTLNRKTGAFVIGGTLSVNGIVNCNGAGSNTGGFYEYIRAGGWGLFGAVDDAQGDKLTIGSFRSNQWQQVRLYTNGTLGITLDSSQNTTFAGWAKAAAFQVGADQVVGARGAAVADAAGGVIVDIEARAAINALLARERAHGLIAT